MKDGVPRHLLDDGRDILDRTYEEAEDKKILEGRVHMGSLQPVWDRRLER